MYIHVPKIEGVTQKGKRYAEAYPIHCELHN